MHPRCNNLDSVIKHWNEKKNIKKVFGKAFLEENDDGIFESDGQNMLDRVIRMATNGEKVLYDGLSFTKKEADTIIKYIDHQEKLLTGEKKMGGTLRPSIGVLHTSALGLDFIHRFNAIENQHRVNMSKYSSDVSIISDYLFNAFEEVKGLKKGEISSIIQEVQSLQSDQRYWKAKEKIDGTDADQVQSKIIESSKKLNKILNDNKEVFELLENYMGDTIKENRSVLAGDEIYDKYPPSIRALGDMMKGFFKDFGKIGLIGMESNLRTMKTILSDKKLGKGVDVKRMGNKVEELRNEIRSLRGMIEDGNYMPHYLLNDAAKLVEKMNKVFEFNDRKFTNEEFEGAVMEAMREVNKVKEPGSFIGRTTEDQQYIRDPMTMMTNYAKMMTDYNRDAFFKSALVETMANVRTFDNEHIRGVLDYAMDRYKTATISYTKRDPFVNKAIKAISTYEYVNKILNLSTGMQNLSQMTHYISTIGIKGYKKASKLLNDSDIKPIIADITKEFGFDFAPEAEIQSLLPELGVVTAVDYDFETGNLRVTTGKGVVSRSIDWVSQKGGKLFAFTERITRKKIFESSMALALDGMRRGGMDITSGQSAQLAMRAAREQGLWNVADNAFEYSNWNKPEFLGGTHKNVGAIGQLFGMFKFYRVSQLDKMIRHAERASIEGFGGYNSRALMGLGLSHSFGMALSSVVGLSFMNFLGQDTIDTVMDFIENYDEPEKLSYGKGLMGNIMPTVMDDLMRVSMVSGLVTAPDEEWAATLLGDQFVNFEDKERYIEIARLLNVNVAKFMQDWDKGFGQYSVLRNVGIVEDETYNKYNKDLKEVGIVGGKRKGRVKKPKDTKVLGALDMLRGSRGSISPTGLY